MILLEFSSSGSLGAKVVKAATWNWCSHVDFLLPDGRTLGASPSRGVLARDRIEPRRFERFVLDAPDQVLDAAYSQVGKPYDWAGILGLGLRHSWQETDAWFCSELVAWSFAAAGWPLLRTADAYRITPRDLLLSPLLVPA